MALSFVRTVILYISVIIAMRIMGKRTIGEMNPTEMVVSIMISDLATVPMQSKSTPLFDGIIPIFTLVVAELVFAYLLLKSRLVRRILIGHNCHVVKDGKLLEKEMEKLRVSIDDIEEQIRLNGYTSLNDISEIVLETNGQVSVVPKKEGGCIPFVIISDGRIRRNDMEQAKIKMEQIEKEIKRQGGKSVKDILYMSAINSEIVCVQKRGDG